MTYVIMAWFSVRSQVEPWIDRMSDLLYKNGARVYICSIGKREGYYVVRTITENDRTTKRFLKHFTNSRKAQLTAVEYWKIHRGITTDKAHGLKEVKCKPKEE